MQIVIDLEDELYEQCKNTELTEENEGFDFHIIKSVANGKPLPKGHGRLIDVERLYDDFESMDYDFEDAIEYAPTIIEADREEKE